MVWYKLVLNTQTYTHPNISDCWVRRSCGGMVWYKLVLNTQTYRMVWYKLVLNTQTYRMVWYKLVLKESIVTRDNYSYKKYQKELAKKKKAEEKKQRKLDKKAIGAAPESGQVPETQVALE